MTRLRFAAFLFALFLLFSACAEDVPVEPSVSASIGEYTTPETTAPVTEEVTDELTAPPETEPEETVAKDMTASERLALAAELCARYNTFTRNSRTKTEIEILGEITESVSESELFVKDGNAVFRRSGEAGKEEYHLVDSFLCFGSSVGKYRIGGMNVSAFLELFSDQLPLGSFEEGKTEQNGSDIVLKFDKLSESGVAYLRKMLGLLDEVILDVEQSILTVRTDSNGHMSSASVELTLAVSSGNEKLMRVKINSEIKQNTIVGIVDLKSPNIADYVLFPNLETIAYYENALAQIGKFKSKRDAFEFTDSRSTKIESDSLSVEQNSISNYAYASRIGLSIDKRFDTADGGGMHSLLTHFNNRRAFSQMDGGNIFFDSTVDKNNLFLTIFRPFDTAFYGITACKSAESVMDGRITLNLNDSALTRITRQILLTSGIPADGMHIAKVNRAVTYIELDEKGALTSLGYEISLRVTIDGKTYTVRQSADITITSHNSAKVKVIYIDVDEDEE